MKRKLFFLIAFLLGITMYGQTVYEPSGKRSVKTVEVGHYKNIFIDESHFDITLRNSRDRQIQIEADDAIHPIIKARVEKDTLKLNIETEGGVVFITTGKINISLPVSEEVQKIHFKMAGNISCEKELKLKKAAIEMEYVSNLNLPLRVDDLQLKIGLARKGSVSLQSKNCTLYSRWVKEIAFSGKVGNLEIEGCDGNLNFENVRVENVFFKEVNGIGTMRLWVEDTLKGSISGILTVQYKGNAVNEVTASGISKVVKQ
ncbi:MAG: GIN domain-containing protein [Capnocytophaga gingivalis]|uniref:GIN domain-containing protein n=1 Tax=Capnocytophaga gingivalis TaxID=1017 RepID=UPI003609A82F